MQQPAPLDGFLQVEVQVPEHGGVQVHAGQVSHLFDTGANAVMVVAGERERLLPFVMDQYVKSVDFDAGRITVDWDPEF